MSVSLFSLDQVNDTYRGYTIPFENGRWLSAMLVISRRSSHLSITKNKLWFVFFFSRFLCVCVTTDQQEVYFDLPEHVSLFWGQDKQSRRIEKATIQKASEVSTSSFCCSWKIVPSAFLTFSFQWQTLIIPLHRTMSCLLSGRHISIVSYLKVTPRLLRPVSESLCLKDFLFCPRQFICFCDIVARANVGHLFVVAYMGCHFVFRPAQPSRRHSFPPNELTLLYYTYQIENKRETWWNVFSYLVNSFQKLSLV